MSEGKQSEDAFKKTVLTALGAVVLFGAGWFVWATQQIFAQTSLVNMAITRGQLNDKHLSEDVAELRVDLKDTRERLIKLEERSKP